MGDVEIGADSSVWPHAAIRAEYGPVRIGRAVSVQDGCVIHLDPGGSVTLADRVTVGHRAVVHGATVGEDSIVGMGAVLLEGSRVGAGCIVAAGAVVREGEEIPDGALAAGVPAKVVRVDAAFRDRARRNAERYVELVARYRAGEFG